ncbi:unnamed protein product [Mycena citricolor]|uniref:Cytochrome P450 n=1 Tax=Mycena citricolor TaxID=2018698 RepID=A0AAD2HDY4_9AGAR|nr:unnamed protein product [Mycena citricolor]
MPTPGVRFLAHLLARFVGRPILLILAVHYAVNRFTGLRLRAPTTILLTLLAYPLSMVFLVQRKMWRQRREARALGARPVPVVKGKRFANLDLLTMLRHARVHGYPGDGFAEWVEELGPVINVRVLWVDNILTTSPDHIKQILATDFNNYEKGASVVCPAEAERISLPINSFAGERFQQEMNSVLGSGVFNSDGEMWKFHRTLTRPYFSRDRISHFEIFDAHANSVISILRTRLRAGYAVDFQDLIGRFTMDSATEFLFGTCVNSLQADVPFAHNVGAFPQPSEAAQVANAFLDAFAAAMHAISEREVLGNVWPLFEMWEDKTAAPMAVVSAFLDPIIEAAVERKRMKKQMRGAGEAVDGDQNEDSTLLDELLVSTDDPKVLKDETLNILLAGRDTTMHVTTMVIYFLSMYPDVCARLRAEVLEYVGPTRRPTYDDVKNMKYLRAVINESMRLYPSVPFNIRDSVNATTWPSPDPNEKPLYIPAQTKCPYSVFLMHRRKDLWGNDAEEFDPDRFIDPARLKSSLLANTFAFLPFNAGPRICLGQQFAYNEMSFVLVRLLQAFESFALAEEDAWAPEAHVPTEWKTASRGTARRRGTDRFRPKVHLTMYAADGMWIRAKEAASNEEKK